MIIKHKDKLIKYFLFIGYLISLTRICHAQTSSPVLEQSIRVSPTATTLGKVLAQISQQTSLSFSYSNEAVDPEQTVQLPDRPLTVKQVLDAVLLPKGLTYTVLDKQIILRKSRSKTGNRKSAASFTMSGYVREKSSGELLPGVTVYATALRQGVVTNAYGFYSLTLPASDSVEVVFSFISYQSRQEVIPWDRNRVFNVDLDPSVSVLQEVVVTGENSWERVSEATQMSTVELPIRQIKEIPALLGEKDVLKVLQLMPGVQKGSEGNGGLYVRGGGPDQNLIILDDATVYNAYHLFGFFSLFNGDALKSVELIKGGFPARYGGRLSSVLDITMKEGNKEKLHGEGGIGLIASRLMLEGPIVKNKASFLVSARRTYADALVYPFLPKNNKMGYYFYDLTAKVNYDLGQHNKLYLSGYFGKDNLSNQYENQWNTRNSRLYWGNATGSLRWNHLFSQRLFANLTLVFSDYRFAIAEFQENPPQFNLPGQPIRGSALRNYTLDFQSSIRDVSLKYDLHFQPNPRHTIRAGIQSTYHRFKPNAVVFKDNDINQDIQRMKKIDAWEWGWYVEDTYRPTTRLTFNLGGRLSQFLVEGKSYTNLEPRFTGAYKLRPDLALKASFATMNQYLHMLSNTGLGLPTDLWVPATRSVAPQRSNQIALGIAKDFLKRNLALTLEGYYKKSDRVIGYKEGATFVGVDFEGRNSDLPTRQTNWENNITQGQGWSYGVEVLLQRRVGRLSGWLGYTLSWNQLQFDSLNFGKKFYARYDRRHDISLVGIYQLSERVTLSGTWVYGTGNALTVARAQYDIPEDHLGQPLFSQFDRTAIDYGDKNSFRMPAYHRLDLGVQFHKKKRWGERTWEVSLYNAYSRQNPYYYFPESRGSGNRPVVTQVSLFPIIPAVSYHFKF
jgi:hypothetical protein